jgi:hypothetical protein
MSAAVYPASPIKPINRRRRTAAQMERLSLQILDVFLREHPNNIRHVFYRMTNPRQEDLESWESLAGIREPVEKSDQGYAQVQDLCTTLRRNGRLPYGSVSDLSRRGYFTHTYRDAGHLIRETKSLFRADLCPRTEAGSLLEREERSTLKGKRERTRPMNRPQIRMPGYTRNPEAARRS